MIILSLILTITFLILALIHFNWAIGNEWGLNASLPTKESGELIFSPRKIDSGIVGIALLTFSFFYLFKSGLIHMNLHPIIEYTFWIIPTIFLLRAIGDFRYAGLFRKIKTTDFARADTKIFTPLCLMLSIIGFIIVSH